VSSPSDSFAKLKEQMDQAAKTVVAAGSEDEAAVRAKIDDARATANARAAQLRVKAQETSDAADDQWSKIRSDWQEHVKRNRQRLDDAFADLDATAAVEDAKWAESDAIAAIDFASAAIDEAEYAVLDALRARRNAEALVGASS
jgi:hypothetical protein